VIFIFFEETPSMAITQRVITECDQCPEGTHGEDEQLTTVSFGIDGEHYDTELCDEQAGKLRGLFAGYVANARKKGKDTTAPKTARVRGQAAKEAREKKEYYGKVREWANAQPDLPYVAPRGQIAGEVLDAYEKAHQPEPAQPPAPPEVTTIEAQRLDEREPAFSG
jgi:hypothetical protein